jgi:hypothetical protein
VKFRKIEPETQTYDASYESLISNYFSDFRAKKPTVLQHLRNGRRTPQFIKKKPRQFSQNSHCSQTRELKLSKTNKVIKLDDLQKQLSARTARANNQTQHFVFEQPENFDNYNSNENTQVAFKSHYSTDQMTIFNDQFRSQNASVLGQELDASGHRTVPDVNSLADSYASVSQYTQK